MNITHSIEIACPPDLVWSYLDDPEKIKRWMKGVVDNVPTSDGPTGVGSTFRMSIKEGGKVSAYDGEILVYDVDEHMRVRLTGGCLKEGMSMTADYRLTPADLGTRLDYRCTGDVTGWWKLVMPVMSLVAKAQIKGFFRTLKSLAEADVAGLPA